MIYVLVCYHYHYHVYHLSMAVPGPASWARTRGAPLGGRTCELLLFKIGCS